MEENKNNAIEKAEKVMRENTSNIEREKTLADKRISLAQKKRRTKNGKATLSSRRKKEKRRE